MSKSQKKEQPMYSLKEVCSNLSISVATGRNWIRSGLLVPEILDSDKKPLFSKKQIQTLNTMLSSGDTSRLKSRRNKQYISGSTTYSSYIDKNSPNQKSLQQILKTAELSGMEFTDLSLCCLLRHCATQLLTQASVTIAVQLLNDIIDAKEYDSWFAEHSDFTQISYCYLPGEDTLGFLYMSLQHLKNKKRSGSYYTPVWLAQKLLKEHLTKANSDYSYLDPSCGTGCFLLQLPDTIPLHHIHGSDLDTLSITLTRINLTLKYKISSREELNILCQNVVEADYLLCSEDKKYDIILGNPPWGAVLTKEQKERYRRTYLCATTASPDTFDLFIEQSCRLLSQDGILSFVLPEALLTVGTHTNTRKLLQQDMRILSVEYLGEVFENIHCPSIILTLTKDSSANFCKGASVKTKSSSFSIEAERSFFTDSFALQLNDAEYSVLTKIMTHPTCTTLVDNAVFAMGIVTGNNALFLTDTPSDGYEPIIKGSDIQAYHVGPISGYIHFQPEVFQQTAKESVYRAPEKLVYRFINKRLTFAYDNSGLLTLNSCNILIPQFKELDIKYILAILNSSIAQFVYEKCFHSVKVLRSHLEQIPIPIASKDVQKHIITLVDQLLVLDNESAEYQQIYMVLDHIIADLYEITENDFLQI